MKILIIGIDGYLGWPLAQHLASKGHVIGGVDAYFRREQVREVGGHSAVPIAKPSERIEAYKEKYGKEIYWVEGDVSDWETVSKVSSIQT